MELLEINKLLQQVGERFDDNELAYLSLTSKVELNIRDRVFSEIIKEVGHTSSKIIPVREYDKIDLAILKEFQLTDIIEFKAGYTFDLLMLKDKIQSKPLAIKWLEDDFKKEKNNQYLNQLPECNQYNVLLLVDVKNTTKIPKTYERIIKYRPLINKFLNNKNNIDIFNECNQKLISNFNSSDYEIEKGVFKGGKGFEMEVDVYYWIIKKKR